MEGHDHLEVGVINKLPTNDKSGSLISQEGEISYISDKYFFIGDVVVFELKVLFYNGRKNEVAVNLIRVSTITNQEGIVDGINWNLIVQHPKHGPITDPPTNAPTATTPINNKEVHYLEEENESGDMIKVPYLIDMITKDDDVSLTNGEIIYYHKSKTTTSVPPVGNLHTLSHVSLKEHKTGLITPPITNTSTIPNLYILKFINGQPYLIEKVSMAPNLDLNVGKTVYFHIYNSIDVGGSLNKIRILRNVSNSETHFH